VPVCTNPVVAGSQRGALANSQHSEPHAAWGTIGAFAGSQCVSFAGAECIAFAGSQRGVVEALLLC
jgi:hypothetical protein